MTTHPLVARVYGDESADETRERVFAVAGVVATDEVWDTLAEAWVARLPSCLADQRFGGRKVFHAAECEASRKKFSRMSPTENKCLYKDLTQLVAHSGVKGFGVGLDVSAYRQFFPDLPRDIEYYKAFSHVLRHFLERATQRELVNFTFDARHESEYNSRRLYDYLLKRPEWQGVSTDTVHFGSRGDPRIQVDDLERFSFRFGGGVAAMTDVVATFGGGEARQTLAEERPERVDRSAAGLADDGLELGEAQLDGVEVGAVGREEAQRRADGFNGVAHAVDFVSGEIVGNHDVAGLQRRHEDPTSAM